MDTALERNPVLDMLRPREYHVKFDNVLGPIRQASHTPTCMFTAEMQPQIWPERGE